MKSLNMIIYNSKYSAQLKIAHTYHIRDRVKADNKINIPRLQIIIWGYVR